MTHLPLRSRSWQAALLTLPLAGLGALTYLELALPEETLTDRIAFQSDVRGNGELYSMNTDGTDQVRLTSNSYNDLCPAFSRDGSRIAFCSNRDGNFEIYVMGNDGGNPVRLTDTTQGEYQPDWSESDTCIVFTRYFTSVTWDYGEIFAMNADGTNERRLTNNAADDMHPIWSPDGSRIIFNSKRDGNYEIYVMNPDGSGVQRLTNTPGNEMFPRFSPDGTKIAYGLVDFQTLAAQVHVMNADGTGDVALTSAGVFNGDPIWSPDGMKIVFKTNRTGNYEIFIMDSDGSEQTNLTMRPEEDYWPSWGQCSLVPVTPQSWGRTKSLYR